MKGVSCQRVYLCFRDVPPSPSPSHRMSFLNRSYKISGIPSLQQKCVHTEHLGRMMGIILFLLFLGFPLDKTEEHGINGKCTFSFYPVICCAFLCATDVLYFYPLTCCLPCSRLLKGAIFPTSTFPATWSVEMYLFLYLLFNTEAILGFGLYQHNAPFIGIMLNSF